MTDYQKSSYWVRIVQPSIEQNTKLSNTEREAIFAAHMNLSATSIVEQHPEPDFIVWPEASIPYLLYDNSTITMRIASLLKPKQWAIIGAIRASNNPLNEKTQYFNTIAVINATGNILTTSDKLHLVPFGEYLPYQNLLKKLDCMPLLILLVDIVLRVYAKLL